LGKSDQLPGLRITPFNARTASTPTCGSPTSIRHSPNSRARRKYHRTAATPRLPLLRNGRRRPFRFRWPLPWTPQSRSASSGIVRISSGALPLFRADSAVKTASGRWRSRVSSGDWERRLC
jgi:hypothetical protein